MIEPLDIVVVGSCMIDLIFYAPRLPQNGETLCGSNFVMGFGGKGCNQCVAAKKLGANCLMVARIGNDIFGNSYYSKLEEYGITRTYVKSTDGVSTGMAQITVADTGENQIVIVMGANEKLSETDVENVANSIVNCKILVCQMEIPEISTIKALQIKAKSNKGMSILNVAPAKANLNPLLFSLPDIFCVNETEAEIITNIKVKDTESSKNAVMKLLSLGCKKVIITLGEKGAVYGIQGKLEVVHVPTISVTAIDTTGAGDAFIGSLAFYLSTQPDLSLEEAIKKANGIAALSVQKLGTQESFPFLMDVPSQLNV